MQAAEQKADAASATSAVRSGEEERLLREDVEAANQEVLTAQEKAQMKQLEVTELQRQRNELRQRLEEIEEEHRAVRTACMKLACTSFISGIPLTGLCTSAVAAKQGLLQSHNKAQMKQLEVTDLQRKAQ